MRFPRNPDAGGSAPPTYEHTPKSSARRAAVASPLANRIPKLVT